MFNIYRKVPFELIQDMKHVIEALTFAKFDFKIRNPELQKLNAGIRSVALELDEMEHVEDETIPKVDWIESQAGSLIAELNRVGWHDCIHRFYRNWIFFYRIKRDLRRKKQSRNLQQRNQEVP